MRIPVSLNYKSFLEKSSPNIFFNWQIYCHISFSDSNNILIRLASLIIVEYQGIFASTNSELFLDNLLIIVSNDLSCAYLIFKLTGYV